ncbi:MAG: ABC transporter permease [Acidimicrobiia bacterium]
MSFLGLVAKNLLRQRVRALLTLLGITIGIITVVALGAVTAGLKATADDFVRSGGADFIVGQEGAADLTFSRIPESSVDAIEAVPGVRRTRPVIIHIISAGANPFFFLTGVSPDALAGAEIDLVQGRLLDRGAIDQVVLGRSAAVDLAVGVGDDVVLDETRFEVVGIFGSEVVWEEGGAIAPLATVQGLTRIADAVSLVYVTVDPDADPEAVAAEIRRRVPRVVTIADAEEYRQIDSGFSLIDAANTAISALAVLIGGIGVMNTMVMSIFERTREIGVLRAVGWSKRRVMRMILLESVLLCLVAAVLGALLGVGVSMLVTLIPAVGNFIAPAYPVSVFVRAALVGLVVGLLGAIYPALRATRLRPMEALRYE